MSRVSIVTPAALALERRLVLQFLGVGSLAATGLASGLVPLARAAEQSLAWPKNAFAQKNEAAALAALFEKPIVVPSDKVSLDVPEIAENGAVVPVSVTAALPNVTAIALLIPENPFTLAACYQIPEGTEPAISCRLKMAKTSDVVAVVQADGKYYSTRKQVKVTLGGCGG
jgi:sulfur-oxidizing protein SoxY